VLKLLIVLVHASQLLVMWAVEGHKVYSGTSGAVPYLSDAASYHRRFFVPGSCATALFYVASLSVERSLRATRVLPEVTSDRALWHLVGIADVLTGACAGLGLCLLSVYDSFHTPRAHLAFTVRQRALRHCPRVHQTLTPTGPGRSALSGFLYCLVCCRQSKCRDCGTNSESESLHILLT
jgi:hypothetical protein